jgi:hypothetical protein
MRRFAGGCMGTGPPLIAFLLLASQPAAAQDPRTWTLWRVDYSQKMIESDSSSVPPPKTRSLEAGLTRVECEIIKQGKVADDRASGHKQSFPYGAALTDVPNRRLLITRFFCSREEPRIP